MQCEKENLPFKPTNLFRFSDKYIQIYTGRFPTIPNILSTAAEEETKYQYM